MTRLIRILIAAAVAGAALVLTLSVDAAHRPTVCASRPAVVEGLKLNFAEVPVAIGLQSDGSVMEVFASAKTGTWTIVVTLPNGTSCAVVEGESWEVLPVRSTDPMS